MHYLQSWYTWQAKLLHVNFLVHRQFLRRLRQISCMIRTGIRRYQGKARGSATLPPLISPRPGSPLISSWSGSKLEINIASAFMIFFSSIFSFHDLCYSNSIFIVDIIIISQKILFHLMGDFPQSHLLSGSHSLLASMKSGSFVLFFDTSDDVK